MNKDDFKRLLDESLKPIKTDLNVVKTDLSRVKSDLKELKESHEELKYTVEGKVLPSVTYIKTNIKAYKDSYQINNANAKKLEKRVEVLEDQAGVIPPPELILTEVG